MDGCGAYVRVSGSTEGYVGVRFFFFKREHDATLYRYILSLRPCWPHPV